MESRKQRQKSATIEATVKGVVSALPEMAVLNLGVITEAKKPGAAARENAKRMATVIAAIKKQGVPEADIQTIGLRLGPKVRWDAEKDEDVLIGYRAENTVRVRVEIDLADDVYDAGVEAGANSGGDLVFVAKDERKERLAALELATKSAVEEITTIAEALGVTLDRPVSAAAVAAADESDEDSVAFKADMEATQPTPIVPGSVDTRATVRVIYGIKDEDG